MLRSSEESELNQVDFNDSYPREEVKTAGFNSRAAPDDDETVIHEVDEENNPEDAL